MRMKCISIFILAFSLFLLVGCNIEETTSPHEHVWDIFGTSEATCTDEGKLTYICHGCNEYKTEILQPLGHQEVVLEAVEATCTSTGLTEGSYCNVCFESLKVQETIPMLNHNYNVEVIEPTFEYPGYTIYTCVDCEYSYVGDEVECLKHEYSNTLSHNETHHWYACVDAGYEYLRKDEENHNFVDVVTPPTFEHVGYTTYTCADCEYSYVGDEVECLKHEYSNTLTYDETTHWYACVDAGYEHLRKDEENHNFVDVVTPPTGLESGYTTHTCSACGYNYVDNPTDPLTYTVTWQNYDETILEVDNNVKYGTLPTYDGVTPIKEKDVQYTYNFIGWDKEISNVTNDITYIAQYEEIINTYAVTWQNYDGTTLEIDNDVEYGTFPTYDGVAPIKERDAQYTYIFIGWDKEISIVTKDVTYIAQYNSIINTYTVTWQNYDETILEIDTDVEYGTLPIYDGATPSKKMEEKHSYTFIGWDKEISIVTKDVTYIALFERVESTSFVVEFDLNGGEGEFSYFVKDKGETINLPLIAPTFSNHNFLGWNNIYENKIYQPGDSFSLDYNMTLFALWEEICSPCEGDGQIDDRWSCSNCKGSGKVKVGTKCTGCNGVGVQTILICNICGTKSVGAWNALICPGCYSSRGSFTNGGTQTCSSCYGEKIVGVKETTCSVCDGVGKGGSIRDCDACNQTGLIKIAAPTLESKEFNKIILTKIDGYEYSIDNINWQTSNIFEGLHSETTYIFYQRIATKDGVPFGVASYSLKVTTPQAPKYTIEYILDGGSANNPQYYTIESEEIKLSYPVKTGYTFVGWTSSDIIEPIKDVVIPSGSTGNKTYRAVWEVNTYTISYLLDGGINLELNPNTYTIESENIILANPTKEHYSFVGWYLDEELSQQVISILKGSHENYTLYAKWELYKYEIIYIDNGEFIPTSFTVTFNSNGGTAVESQKVTAYNPLKYPEIPTKTGYYFIGWYLDLNSNEQYDFSKSVTKDLTLYAKWQEGKTNRNGYTYPVIPNHYNKNESVYSIDRKNYIGYYDCYKAFAVLETGEYRFYSDGSRYSPYIEVCDDNLSVIISKTGNYDFTLYLRAGQVIYLRYFANVADQSSSMGISVFSIKINIDGPDPADGGVVLLQDEYTIETPTFELNPHYKTGYEFVGWFSEETFENQVTEICKGSHKTYILYAKWERVEYTITYDLAGGTISELNPSTYTIESENIILSNPTKVGHTFVGWISSDISDPVKDLIISTGSSGDKTFIAVWEVNEYKVTWQNYDGSVLVIEDVEYGKIPTYKGETPLREGNDEYAYKFIGWDREVIEVTGDVTYVAQFEQQYFITYNLDGGINNDKNPAYYTSSSDTLNLLYPTRVGYTFIGWTGTNGDEPQLEVSFDGNDLRYREYTANWELTAFNVEYVLYGGTNSSKNPNFITILDEFELKAPTKTGYTFDQWYLDEECSLPISTIVNTASDITIYAKFIPNEYSATFINDAIEITLKVDGFADKVYVVEYGDTFDPYSYEVMSNYLSSSENTIYAKSKFLGWSTTPSGTSTSVGSKTLKEDTILYGKFSTSEFPICSHTYTYGGSSSLDTKLSYEYNTSTGYSYMDGGSGCYTVPALCTGYIDFTFDLYYGWCEIRKNGTIVYSTSVEYTNQRVNTDSTQIHFSKGDHIDIYLGSNYSGSNRKYTTAVCHIGGLERKQWILKSENSSKENFYFDEIIQTPTYSKPGYDIKWVDENGTEIANSWNYLSNKVFRAEFSPIQYKISYVLDGGTNSLLNPGIYTLEDRIELANPFKEGYTFEGWYLDSDFNQKITSINKQTGDVKLYAKFSVNSYNATLDFNGGTLSPKVTFMSDDEILNTCYLTKDSKITSYYPIERDGYIFGGWYNDPQFQFVFDFNKTVKEELTLYAKWIVNDLKYHIIKSNETEAKSIIVNGLNETYITFVPISSGYITIHTNSDMDVKGILYNSSMNKITEADDISDENLNFSIRYYVNAGTQYIIAVKGATSLTKGECDVAFTFEGNLGISGTTYDSYSFIVEYNSPFNLPILTKEGYKFLGWIDENGDTVNEDCWKYSTDMILYACWKANEYTITYNVNGGNELESNTQIVTYNSEYELVEPTRSGYRFIEWQKDNIKFESGT